MNPQVSIIVPIYNADRYLERCIKSIINQSLKNIEIILVNDGSNDNSLTICKNYEKNDNRIKVINQENCGVSAARNAGLKIATGEYIGFVDPDDWIDTEMYESLYRQIKKDGSEICICNFIKEVENKSIPNCLNIEKSIICGNEIFNEIIVNMIKVNNGKNGSNIMGSVCRLLIKKNFIENNNFKFKSDIKLMEDLIFCIEILLKSKKVSINKGTFYHYHINSNSAVNSYRENIINEQLKVYYILEKLLKNNIKNNSNLVKILNNRYINIYLRAISNEFHEGNKKSFFMKLKYLKKEILKDNKLFNLIKTVDFKDFSFKKSIVIRILKLLLIVATLFKFNDK